MGNYLGLQSATEDSKPAEPMESPTPEELAREKEIEACVVCKKSDNPLEEGPICYNTTLKGTVKPYYRHIIVCTGQVCFLIVGSLSVVFTRISIRYGHFTDNITLVGIPTRVSHRNRPIGPQKSVKKDSLLSWRRLSKRTGLLPVRSTC